MSGEAGVIIGAFIVVLGVIILTQLFIRYKKRENMEKEPKFEIFLDKKKKFRFRLIAPNGEIICQSEGYESKQACKDTIDVLGTYASIAKTIET